MVAFFEALENKMPSTFMVNTLSANRETVIIDATVSTKEEVAAAIANMKQIDGFITADLAAVTKVENSDTGESSYNFVAELRYAPIMLETEEVAEGEAE